MSVVNKVGRVGSLRERLVRGMKVQDNGCWEWQRGFITNGYGRTSLKGVPIVAHRASYEVFVGKIPDGLFLDHLCRNKKCINPAHLEAVTHRENVRRGIGLAAANAKKTHCKNGHEFNAENTYLYGDGSKRGCRLCRLQNQRRRHGTIGI